MDRLPVEVRISLSKSFPPGSSELRFGSYMLRAIPSDSPEDGEAVLAFDGASASSDGGNSHPEEEAASVRHLLSLLLDARSQKRGLRIDHLDIPPSPEQVTYPQFFGSIDASSLASDFDSVLSLEDDILRQYLRAAHAYAFATEFIPSDITFAFFLLVVSIECLSSQNAVIPFAELDADKKKAERFVRFVQTFLPDDMRGDDERDDELFRKVLKTVYYSHRSGFAHGGKEVSGAAIMADRVGSSYLKHEVDGKQTKTPGIGWFARVARDALLGYLRSGGDETSAKDPTRLGRLALEKAGLQLKVKRPMEKYSIVTFDDVEYR